MKKIFLAGAALAALTAGAQAADVSRPFNPITAPPALQTVSGDLGLYGGVFSFADNDPYSFGGSVIGGLARANVWISPGVSAQFDLNGENLFSTSDGDDYSVVNLAAHLSMRTPGYLLGVFGSVGYNGYWGQRVATIGAEAQTYMGPFQLYGQVGGTFNVVSNGGSFSSAFYVHGEARYFLNPNLMLAANLGFAQENDSGGSWNPLRWGLDLETKMNNSPFGFFASYQGSHESFPGGYNFTVHTIMGGIKIHINNNTLQSEAQAGSTLNDKNPITGVNHLRLNDY